MDAVKKYWPVAAITIIIAGFIAAVVFNRNFKDDKKAEAEKESMRKVDEMLGYTPEDYITLGQYKNLKYDKLDTTVTEAQVKEVMDDDLTDYRTVDREAKKDDQVGISYKAYIDGKKEKNLCSKEYYITLGEEDLDESVDNAIKGHKAGYEFEVSIENPYYFEMEDEEVDYEGKVVDFKFKILSVEEPYLVELTDKWVAANYGDYDIKTVEEYNKYVYDTLLEENQAEAESDEKEKIREIVSKNSTMKGYPDEVYNMIKEEDDADLKKNAEDIWGVTVQEYIRDNDIDLEEMYKDDVKWELIKRAIAKKEAINVSEDEINEGYYTYYEYTALDSPEEMMENYTDEDVERMVLEDKILDFIIESSNK